MGATSICAHSPPPPSRNSPKPLRKHTISSVPKGRAELLCQPSFLDSWTNSHSCVECCLLRMIAADYSSETSVSQKTWGGRFTGPTDARVEDFTESISFDRRLARHDIRASQAHARMLAEVGLLTSGEAEQIVAALDAIAGQIDRGEM